MSPLLMAEKGKDQIVKKIGGNESVRRHLADLGFCAGGTISVVSELGGNLIVKVKESRVAIDESLAKKIMV